MNLLQMMMARRVQRNAYGGSTGATATGCGCLGSIVSLVVLAGSLYFGYRIWDSTMDTVDASLEQVDESLEDLRTGDLTGVGYEGSYTCEMTAEGAVASIELTNTDAAAHTYDLTWSLFAVPVATDLGDVGDLMDLGTDLDITDLMETIDDEIVAQPGETVTRTYEAPAITDENLGCGPPFLLTDMP